MDTLRGAVGRRPIVVLTGPRRCGKTKLARQLVDPQAITYFDLEDPRTRALFEEPMTALEALTGLVVIDEVQLAPELFPLLRVLVDRRPLPSRFLVLGSASGDLLRQSSESLAGRVEHVRMGGLTLDETGAGTVEALWRRGGCPDSLLAPDEEASVLWRRVFIDTLVERDLPRWGGAGLGHCHAPLLDDGRALPRPGLEQRGPGTCPRGQRDDGPAVSRSTYRCTGRSPVATLACQPTLEAGERTEGLRS